MWAVRGGGTGGADELYGVAVDAAGAVVAAGTFQSTTATFGDVALTLAGSSDTVLWKLNKEGTTLWAVRGGGTNGAAALKDVTVDGVGAVVAAGYFSATTATFGDETLNKASAGNDGSSDALLWKLSDEGTTLWVERAGGTSYDQLNGVALDGANGVVGAGWTTSSTAYFGDTELTNAGQTDAVVWKVSHRTMF